MAEIIIYTKSYCPYCVKAKQLFAIKNLAYKEIDVTDKPDLFEQMLEKSNGKRTVPQIFINNHHIGGCDDLYSLHEQNKLNQFLA